MPYQHVSTLSSSLLRPPNISTIFQFWFRENIAGNFSNEKFQFPNCNPISQSYSRFYLTIFQSGFCPQVLCASQRAGGGGGRQSRKRRRKRRGRRRRRRRRRRTLTQNTTLPHYSPTLRQLPLAQKNYPSRCLQSLEFAVLLKSVEIVERAVWRWGDCALKATRPWHKQSNIKYHPNSRKFKYSKIPIVLIIIKNL